MAEQGRTVAADAEAKDIYVYDFDENNECIEVGVTRNLRAREDELIRQYGYYCSSIAQVGLEQFTRAQAERKLKEMAEKGYPVNMDTLKALEG